MMTEGDIFERALEQLESGGSVRISYNDRTHEATGRVVNALIEFGARVTCEDPFAEPAWLEMKMREEIKLEVGNLLDPKMDAQK